jgi:HEPN domain-containing protein
MLEWTKVGIDEGAGNIIMFDKVEYWLKTAEEDISAAKVLYDGKKYLHMGFFCHLIAEKALKAVVANVTGEQPPKIHHLMVLARKADVIDELSEEQLEFLDRLLPLQIDGRYPEYKLEISKKLNADNCRKLLEETEGFLCWVKKKLER